MPTPNVYNKYTCSCGLPFSSLRLLNSHYQRFENHKNMNRDIVMQEVKANTGKLNLNTLTFFPSYYVSNREAV